MMRRLFGAVQNYPWGSTSRIPRLLGVEPDGSPWAEYWLGAHPLGPARLETESDLGELIAERPELLGEASRRAFGDRLPYMLKLLAASTPLSLQAHPSREQAEAGFAAQEAAGIPLSAPERTFRDDWPKPELIVALTPFSALCGFRDPRRSAALFSKLELRCNIDSVIGPLTARSEAAGLAEVFLDVLSLSKDRRHFVDEVVAAAVHRLDEPGELGLFARTAVELDEHFPGDPSILAALLLNRIQLNPGEALFLGAGQMHSYLRGTAVELMANSDNVLRGGLTKKHIDVDGLISVVDFRSREPDVLTTVGADGLYRYPTDAREFELWWLEPISGPIPLPKTEHARVALVTEGAITMRSGDQTLELPTGGACFLDAGESAEADGAGQFVLAAPGLDD